jgi:cation diffusion facilitator family transporter
MFQKILSRFVKDGAERDRPEVRERYGKLAGLMGIVSNLLLFGLKLGVGLWYHSLSVIADAVNNLSDAGASVVTLAGFQLAGRPADREHPYGHGRYEYIAGLIVSFIIILIGFQLALASVAKIRFPTAVTLAPPAFLILLASIAIKLGQSRFYQATGRLIRSQALAAAAADSRNDVISTAAVLISAAVSRYSGLPLDGCAGLLVALFIIWSGVSLTKETLNPLLGERPDEELVSGIWARLEGYKDVLGYHDLMIHNYGPGRSFVTVHAEVPADRDVLISHELIDGIEEDFFRATRLPLTIHMDPVVVNDPMVNEAKEKIGGILKAIDPSLTFHDFRMVPGEASRNLIFDVAVDFDFALEDMALKTLIRQKTREQEPTWRTVVKIDRHYF